MSVFYFVLYICLHEDGPHQRHGVQKVVEHQYDGICFLPCVGALVNKIVDLSGDTLTTNWHIRWYQEYM